MIHKIFASAFVSLLALLMLKRIARVSQNLTLFTYVPQASYPFGNLANKKKLQQETGKREETFINDLANVLQYSI